MELLDAALAFALTLGALATVVTIIMETLHRLLKIRERNLIWVLSRLCRNLPVLSEDERWRLVAQTLNNPSSDFPGLPASTPADGRPGEPMKHKWWYRFSGVYNWISLEHVLRRLAELPSMTALATQHPERASAELDRVARQYQEIRSGNSAFFKRRAQFWSVILGIAFAFSANVDAVRIFDTYKTDNKVAAKIIAQQSRLEKSAAETEKARAALAEAERTLAEKEAEYKKSNPPDAAALKSVEKAAKEVESKRLAVQSAHTSFRDLVQLGVPVGWEYWPYGDKDAPAKSKGEIGDSNSKNGYGFGAHLVWAVKVIVAGLLIGLGAPFWFDVAKRLGEIRKAFGGTPPAETRLSGKDDATTAEERKKLADQIVKDVRENSHGAGELGAPDATISQVQTLLTELGEIQDGVSALTGLLDLPTRTAIDRFLDKHFAPEDRVLIFGAMTDPDFFPRLINELKAARDRNAA